MLLSIVCTKSYLIVNNKLSGSPPERPQIRASSHLANGIIVWMEMVTILSKRLCPAKRGNAPSWGRLPVLASAALFCVLVFAILAWQLKAGGLTTGDGAITGWVRADITPGLTSWMILITGLGSFDFAAALTTLAVLFLLIHRKWGDGLRVAAASLSSWLLYTTLKLVFQRPRPDLPHLVPVGGYSFPSGHATVTAALFFTLAMVYCGSPANACRGWGWPHPPALAAPGNRNRTGRVLALAAAMLLVLLVGISRVYLGVHYPSDVLAGWAAGGLLTLVIAMLPGPGFRAS